MKKKSSPKPKNIAKASTPKKPVLAKLLLKNLTKKPEPLEPLWKGPAVDGITQSLLGLFLMCRERFRIRVIEGWSPAEGFNHRIEYGSMWHVCEESYGQGKAWEESLEGYCSKLMRKYPLQQEQIRHWWSICEVQYPIYLAYWKQHPDQKGKEVVMSEETFSVPYLLPSGRTVLLRGKFDEVDWIREGNQRYLYLQENKTKGDIQVENLQKQLDFDLQTMFYLVALEISLEDTTPAGVRYNVIRRPLAGGKHSISPHKGRATANGVVGAESMEDFYKRLSGEISGDPDYFFMRWKVRIGGEDIARFKTQFLTPILEQLYDWWEWVTQNPLPTHSVAPNRIHWRSPYGMYNPLADNKPGDIDDYLRTGSVVGLERTPLFKELA